MKAGDTAAVTAVTRAFLSFVPNPIGVGQTLLVNFWINPALPSNDVIIPEGGYVITITKPDGTKDVRTLRFVPATAATWYEYVADQVGFYVEDQGWTFLERISHQDNTTTERL